jgi:hypothetical protein
MGTFTGCVPEKFPVADTEKCAVPSIPRMQASIFEESCEHPVPAAKAMNSAAGTGSRVPQWFTKT